MKNYVLRVWALAQVTRLVEFHADSAEEAADEAVRFTEAGFHGAAPEGWDMVELVGGGPDPVTTVFCQPTVAVVEEEEA